jgi:hypothetical protein
MAHLRIAGVVIGLAACISVAASSPRPTASLTIEGDEIQPAAAPVVLKLRVRNTGAARMSYWCSGPGEYPDASDYVATVERVDEAEPPQAIIFTNGQKPGGDGLAMDLRPNRSLTFPVTLGLLAPGRYRITVTGAGSRSNNVLIWPETVSERAFRFEVRHDNELSAARDAEMIARVRANDPFARYLSATWPRRAVRDALVADVTGDDVVAADRAADGLWGDAEPAKVDGPLVARAILKHLKPPPDGCDIGLMTRLTRVSQPVESDELKTAMTKLILARPEGSIRQAAAASLDHVSAKVATKLLELANAGALPITDADQRARHDAALLGAMLELARSADRHERKLAYRALVDFPSNQAALDTLRAGLMDPDPECQSVANTAMGVITKWQATTQP